MSQERTCGPPAGKDARLFTSSVLFLIISLVASVRLCLKVSGASGQELRADAASLGECRNGWEHTDLSVKLDHPLVLLTYRLASGYPVHLTES